MKDAATVVDDAPCCVKPAAELHMRSSSTHSVSLLFHRSAHLRVEQKTWKMVTCPIFGVLGGPRESPDSVGSGGSSSRLCQTATLTDAACQFHLEI